ncbi:MAG: Gfo/Idh/MocA family oxidoreductase [Polyangiaceae bacterium]|nr:Gfo/Idh/MocA family oxidoreductase [Polyangiaceae bacterium]
MVSDLRIAIAGLGRWGPAQHRAFARAPGARVTALADPDPVRLRSHGAPEVALEPSVTALLGRTDVDAIVLATPSNTHADLAEHILRAGRHVLVEKPLAFAVTDAERVVRAAATSCGVAMMGHLLEHHPAINALTRLVDEGALGDLVHIQSRRLATRVTRDDPWWTLAPHDLGLCLRFAGTPTHVRLRRDGSFRRAHLAFANGASAEVEVAFAAPRRVRELRLVGMRATALVEDGVQGPRLWVQPNSSVPNRPMVFDACPLPLDVQAHAFVEACRTGRLPPRCEVATGLEVVRWLGAAADGGASASVALG